LEHQISVTSVSARHIVFNFNPPRRHQKLRLMATYITSDPGETVLRDDRVMVFHYPDNRERQFAGVKGNHVPNSSFECGIGAFWRYVSLSGAPMLCASCVHPILLHGTTRCGFPCQSWRAAIWRAIR